MEGQIIISKGKGTLSNKKYMNIIEEFENKKTLRLLKSCNLKINLWQRERED